MRKLPLLLLFVSAFMFGCASRTPTAATRKAPQLTGDEIMAQAAASNVAHDAEARARAGRAYEAAFEAAKGEALRGDDANTGKRSASERKALDGVLGDYGLDAAHKLREAWVREARWRGEKEGRAEGIRLRIENYIASTPKLSPEDQKIIRGERFAVGFTSGAVRAAWGEPRRINRTVGVLSVSEQWVYGDGSTYLYFENGVLHSYQTFGR